MNFYDDLAQFSHEIALKTGEDEQSYQKLAESADRFSRKLPERSLVFALLRNCPDSVIGYLSCLRSRNVPLLLKDSLDPTLLANLLELYQPPYVYLPADSQHKISGSEVHSQGGYKLIKTPFEMRLKLHDDLALLLTTSGSTGSPKLVRLSYKNINSNAASIAQYLEISAKDRPITTLPMSYSYGLSVINSHLLKGSSIILTQASLTDRNFWKSLEFHQATSFAGVPYIYEMIKKLRFAGMKLPSLRYLTQAGGKLSSELIQEFCELCTQKEMKFFVMYGQTEATARMSYLPWTKLPQKIGSVGIPIPGGKFWLEDEHQKIIEKSQSPGELIYQGDNVSLGYAENLEDLTLGDLNQGILRTGDVATRDDENYYYIVGRKQRFLKIFGNRVNLNEMEQIIEKAGFECACSGIDDHLKIFVTDPAAKSALQSYLMTYTGLHAAAFTFVVIDKIPRNEAGKILYAALKEKGVS